ncbi:hypothetical protein KKG31_08655 [Patescibacteria group bacterium]|nr:hypothetical protein [Patescibacteria group bacterium]MBU1759123.1 hypothetical protein [Patescibacteria group bacterium]
MKDMKALLFEKYYFQKDKERKIRYHDMLDRVYSFFEREYPEVDPVISTALLTDREVFTISELLRDNPKMQYQDLPSNIGICEILHHIKGVKMDQNTTK